MRKNLPREGSLPAIQLESAARSICQEQGLAFVGIAGVGAFKETYRTFDGAGTPWALKVYLPGKAIARAEREITAMLRCSHPNIARLASVGLHSLDSSQYCYLIEEFLPGGTLSAEIETRGTMFPREAVLELGTALISAIGCVAAARLVHRDLKPENVMLRADGRDCLPVLRRRGPRFVGVLLRRRGANVERAGLRFMRSRVQRRDRCRRQLHNGEAVAGGVDARQARTARALDRRLQRCGRR
ncbi:MAG: protein kinase [Myxococcales bacterium]|nr:protein kinase [Myxococcales bacterium]